jgi:hypothetical protein
MKPERQGGALRSGQAIRYTTGLFAGRTGVLVRCLDPARDVWTVKLDGQARELVSPGGHFDVVEDVVGAAPQDQAAASASTLRCDVCGKPLPDPRAALWSYWPKGTKPQYHAAMAAMADGVYCSPACARHDTAEAKLARREKTNRLEMERARGRGEHRYGAIWDEREREQEHVDDPADDWPPRVTEGPRDESSTRDCAPALCLWPER